MFSQALYRDDAPPPRNQVFLAPCNASDPYQQWEHAVGSLSTIKNRGNGECLNQTIVLADGRSTGQNPMMTAPCDAKTTLWQYQHNKTITTPAKPNHCINIQDGDGPDVDIWDCHPPDAPTKVGRETVLLFTSYTLVLSTSYHFTKTGSGQT